jgi:quercetin dioxygenase-like cupin family protein
MPDEHPDPTITMTNVDDVAPVSVNTMTVAHDEGTARIVVAAHLNGSRDIFVSNFRMGPNQHHPRHIHPNVDEVYFILDGRCRMQVGDRDEWLEAGTAVFVPRGTPHGTDTGDEGVSLLVIYPEGDFSNVGKVFVDEDRQP